MRNIRPIGFLVCGLVVAQAQSVQAGTIRIESVVGGSQVDVVTKKKTKKAHAGSPLAVGDTMRTDAVTSARILYPDQSQLLVGKSTEIEIQKPEKGGQWARLGAGSLRAIIAKPKGVGNSKVIRFGVRTRSAVMGVRGTDFVVDQDAQGPSEVRTLEGSVEAAKDDKSLTQGKGVSLSKDQMLKVDPKAAFPKMPEKFDSAQFLEGWKARQPDLSALTARVPRPEAELKKLEKVVPKVEAPKIEAPKVEAPKIQPPAPPAPPPPPPAPALPKNPFGR